jgi:hypothetical protein
MAAAYFQLIVNSIKNNSVAFTVIAHTHYLVDAHQRVAMDTVEIMAEFLFQ